MTAATADLAKALLAADDRRHQCLLARDVAGLAAMLTDDLVYTHSNSRIDTKTSYLAGIESGRTVFRTVKRSNAAVHSAGPGVAWITGRQTADVTIAGADRILDLTYLAVWVEDGAAWRMAAWQSTVIPPA